MTSQPENIDAVLAERGKRYGSWPEHARITCNIKRAMRDSPNWKRLADDQAETLEMVAQKLGRILNGDPDYHDSWHDIVGYVKLVADRLIQPKKSAIGPKLANALEKLAVAPTLPPLHYPSEGSTCAPCRKREAAWGPEPIEPHYLPASGRF